MKSTIIFGILIMTVCVFIQAFNSSSMLNVFANTPSLISQSVVEDSAINDEDIQDFKDKIATRVAELRNENGTVNVFAGRIHEVNEENGIVKIIRNDESELSVLYDEDLTGVFEIVSNKVRDYTFEDLGTGDYIFAIGPEVDGIINAESIYVDTPYILFSGTILEADYSGLKLTLQTPSKEEFEVSVTSKTPHSILDVKSLELDRTTFSKFKAGDVVHIVAEADSKVIDEEERSITYDAVNTLLIPQEFFEHTRDNSAETSNEEQKNEYEEIKVTTE